MNKKYSKWTQRFTKSPKIKGIYQIRLSFEKRVGKIYWAFYDGELWFGPVCFKGHALGAYSLSFRCMPTFFQWRGLKNPPKVRK